MQRNNPFLTEPSGAAGRLGLSYFGVFVFGSFVGFLQVPPNSYRIADKSLLVGTGINNEIEGGAASCRP
jgi:hypothetical protein